MAQSPVKTGSSGEAGVPRPGEVIEGKYRVEKILGEGGMAVVLAAHHELLDQRVAVKVLTARDEKAISRFSFEAQSTARLKSEHVARVMDVGTLPGGAPFMVMEYLEGCDLEELLKVNGPLPVEEAVGYILQALEGLSQAHGFGIVHRDLKPANLFLAVHPSGGHVIKIVDFGISKSIVSRRSGNTGSLTAEHSTVGSPAYMAPEQIRASRDVDPRADLWSLGVVLYELLCGKPPFSGESIGAIFAAVLEKEAPELSTRSPRVPAPLSAAVARCIRRDPGERHPDVLALARDLAPFGPPDSAARVTRIAQTLQAATARGDGTEVRTSSVRVSIGRISVGRAAVNGDLTADLTDTGSHEIRFAAEGAEQSPAGSAAPPGSKPGRPQSAARGAKQLTAGHVAFTSDTPNPDAVVHGATLPSLARRSRKRAVVAVVGATGAAAVIAIVAIIRTTAASPDSRSPASVSATPPSRPASSNEPSSPPRLPDHPPVSTPAATAAGVASPVKTKPTPLPRRAPAPTPAATKRHYGVLDSPD